jgi:hypothetical protein
MRRYLVATLVLATALLAAPGMAQYSASNAAPDPELDAALQAARERLDAAARDLAELHREIGPRPQFDVHRLPIPMRLGMFLGRPRADGIEIMGVTPQGPAAASGLESGDLLTSINGYALGGTGMEIGRGLDGATRDLAPGDYVQVEFQRGDETRTAEIEVGDVQHPMAIFGTASTGTVAFQSALPSPSAVAVSNYSAPVIGRPMGVVLHDLNPGLGRYFSVDAGILVLSGGDDPDALMPGDVIIELNGERIARQHELFAGVRAADASVTVVRDGGELTLPLRRDDLMGGMGVMRAMPLGAPPMFEMRQIEGEQNFDLLINSDARLVGDGL